MSDVHVNTTTPTSISRYRSRRSTKSARGNDETTPPLPEPLQQQTSPDISIARSRSRYRRANPGPPPVPDPLPTIPSQHAPPIPVSQQAEPAPPQPRRNGRYATRRPVAEPRVLGRSARVSEENAKALDKHPTRWTESESPEQKNSKDTRRSSSTDERELSPTKAHLGAPIAIADGPPTSSQIRATKPDEIPYDLGKADSNAGLCFGLFKRKRSQTNPQPEQSTAVSPPLPDLKDAAIKMGGGGIVPGTDAPVSAVNAGDRHVLIECGKSTMLFPVTPETTPVDLIKSASTVMSEPIDVRTAVLKEHFGTVGLQRFLRRYEHVRDVMNSWDSDRQNSLLLVHPEANDIMTELCMEPMTSARPPEGQWTLYYPYKPGKWELREVILKSDGQITSAKSGSKSPQENLCHLSDFDIYIPLQDKSRKKIKPPKAFCYAIKSQQKTAMFESADNFVHYFSHGDKSVAQSFYASIQKWRSWYLTTVMGEGKRGGQQATKALGTNPDQSPKGHKSHDSVGSHYQLGSFQPLMGMSFSPEDVSESLAAMKVSNSTSANQTSPPHTRRKGHSVSKIHDPASIVQRGIPQLAEDEPLANFAPAPSATANQRLPPAGGKSEEFPTDSLLGRSYSQRRHEVEVRDSRKESPWVAGPNLLNGGRDAKLDMYADAADASNVRRSNSKDYGDVARRSSVRVPRQRTSHDLAQTNSRSPEQPKPLVDLTPQQQVARQHTRKGRGFKPDSSNPGALVDNATSLPDNTTFVPPGHVRQSSVSASRPRAGTLNNKNPAGTEVFQNDSLLAQSQAGWGGAARGRGYMDGTHAKGPMLNVAEGSMFAQGSWLNRIEAVQGRDGPTIDREKRIERDEKVGEGF